MNHEEESDGVRRRSTKSKGMIVRHHKGSPGRGTVQRPELGAIIQSRRRKGAMMKVSESLAPLDLSDKQQPHPRSRVLTTATILCFKTRKVLQPQEPKWDKRPLTALLKAKTGGKARKFRDRHSITAQLEELGEHLCGIVPLDEAWESIERGMLRVALACVDGRHVEAAALLSIDESYLKFIIRNPQRSLLAQK
jgi:hypothetical protein